MTVKIFCVCSSVDVFGAKARMDTYRIQPRPQAQPLRGHCVELTAGRGGKRAVVVPKSAWGRGCTEYSPV